MVHIGTIFWKTSWRRYVFEPQHDCIFDATCLMDIVTFLNDLMAERKPARKIELLSSVKKAFYCDNCFTGIIKAVFNQFTDHNSCEIGNCNNCGHQIIIAEGLFTLTEVTNESSK